MKRLYADTCAMLHTSCASPSACRGANGAVQRWPAGQPSSVEQPAHTRPLRPGGQSQRCSPHQYAEEVVALQCGAPLQGTMRRWPPAVHTVSHSGAALMLVFVWNMG